MLRNRFFQGEGFIVPFTKVIRVLKLTNGEIEVFFGVDDEDHIVTSNIDRLNSYMEWLNEDYNYCCCRQKPWNREK